MFTYSYYQTPTRAGRNQRKVFQAQDANEAWHLCRRQARLESYELLAVQVGSEWLWVTDALETQGGLRPANQY